LSSAFPIGKLDEPVVQLRGESGLFKQGQSTLHKGYELQVCEGVGDKIFVNDYRVWDDF
jgi:hypothetical protein